jgi:flagellar biosynthesis regulator FlaF
MTLDEVVAKAAAEIDERIAELREQEVALLRAQAEPTEEEGEEFVHFRNSVWQEWRTEQLAKLCSWLERDCKPLH